MLSVGLPDAWRKPVVATSLRKLVCAIKSLKHAFAAAAQLLGALIPSAGFRAGKI